MMLWLRGGLGLIATLLLLAGAGPMAAWAQGRDNLAALNKQVGELRRAGKYGEAIDVAKRALALTEQQFEPDHQQVGTALYSLALLYGSQGRHAEAEPLYQRALSITEKALGPDHPDVGSRLNSLGELYRTHGRYAEAEPLHKRALAITEKALGPDHPDVGTSLNNLAFLYGYQGRHAEAESLHKRALAITEKALGPDHPDVGTSLSSLAGLYRSQGRYAEAEPLYKRALAITEKALGPDHPDVGIRLNYLAVLYYDQGRYAEAEPMLKRALAISEKALGPDHPEVATSLDNLAGLYREQGRYAEAEPLHKRALAVSEKALGPDHPDVATSLDNLAGLYREQGRYAEAERLHKRALAVSEKALGPDHPDVALSLNNLAWVYFVQGDWARAADFWRRSTGVVIRRAQRGTADLGQAVTGKSKGEAERASDRFEGLVQAVHRLASTRRGDVALSGEMFQAAQWASASEAAASLAQMAARGTKGDPALAAIVRERQDLVGEWQARDKLLIAAVSEGPDKRNAAAEQGQRTRLAAIDTRVAEIDRTLAKDYPGYAALVSPEPLSVADVQAMLSDEEALLLFLDTPARRPAPEETFLWVVTKTDMRWVRSDVGTVALRREVAALRCGLDFTAWHDHGGQRCGQLLGIPLDKVPGDQDPLPFDHARSYKLYQALFGEVEQMIAGKHLLVVPSGPLTNLPLQVLVTAPPNGSDHRSIAWLARKHALTVLPSVASLKALRRVAQPSLATKAMIGFGNPLLDGEQHHPLYGSDYKQQAQLARDKQGCQPTAGQAIASLRATRRGVAAVAMRGGLADIAELKAQTPLPETADEVCAVASHLNAQSGDIRLGAHATEREVKSLSENGALAQYRIVHFATHGALAGQLSNTTEAGLILTPPETATAVDDGYLSASEIAALKLDADWVILSACNTAAGGATGAQALSGLARAFFYAQARALLVSHWAVDSDATVKLVTATAKAATLDRSVGRAEALRRAMLALIDTGAPHEAHPSFWAPFVVVGEGAVK